MPWLRASGSDHSCFSIPSPSSSSASSPVSPNHRLQEKTVKKLTRLRKLRYLTDLEAGLSPSSASGSPFRSASEVSSPDAPLPLPESGGSRLYISGRHHGLPSPGDSERRVQRVSASDFNYEIGRADDPYRYLTWTVTYGTISPLGVPQQGILINGQFPGPTLDCMTNDNIILTVVNKLDQPFLITWNGIKQRKNSWQDGVLGTNCPIPPGGSCTYNFQAKDQIGTYSYFPSVGMQKASGGFGGIAVVKRPFIPVPYPPPSGDFTVVIGDWSKLGHKTLRNLLDMGRRMPAPDAVIINGQQQGSTFNVDQGNTCLFRISNVGLQATLNFRIQGHKLKVVEIEGAHPLSNFYDSVDVHVGQSMSVLVTADQEPKDYYIVASTRFTRRTHTATAVLHYTNSHAPVFGPIPAGPPSGVAWSLSQAKSFRWNLTASAARPNPQGSFHYGTIAPAKTIVFANSGPNINGKRHYAINSISYVNPDTPLKLADYFNIPGVFNPNSIPELHSTGPAILGTGVYSVELHTFVEIVFQNTERTLQSWHLDGYDFWVVGMGTGQWSQASRRAYNLVDAPTRYTVQVYPNGWTAIYVSLDNQGMWNLRSAIWHRQYLGQQLYIRVWNEQKSFSNEYDIPTNALLCGSARGQHV